MTRDLAVKVGAGVFALFVLIMLANALLGGSRAKVEARLNGNVAGAALESGRDAVSAVGAQGASEAAIDTITKENDHAIRQAPGAAAPVDRALSSTALRGLCRRASYHRDPRCLQFTPAR